MFCRNCGAELPESASICPKCGTAVSPSAEPVAKEAVLQPSVSGKSSPKKKIFIASAVLIIVLGLLAVAAWNFLSSKDPGYYQNIPWGTSYEDFMQEHPKAFGSKKGDGSANVFSTEDSDPLQGFESEEIGGTTLLLYQFDKDGLYRVSWSALNSAHAEELIPEIIQKYNKLYGKSTRSDDPTANKDLKEFNYIWKTDESSIQLLSVPGMGSVMVIQTEIGHSEAE